MAELTEAATEAVAEVAEEVADQAEHVAEVSRAVDGRALGIGLTIGLVGGGVIGGLYMNRRLRLKYEQIAEAEIEEMREHFRKRLVAKEEKPDLNELSKVVKREGYAAPNVPIIEERKDEAKEEESAVVAKAEEVEVKEEASEAVQNVFNDEWDYEAEIALRRPEYPYVIHIDEQHERDYTESTLTYYAGDDVLCDERDNVIEDPEHVVGVANLEKFGHGSGDKNIVYIRNDQLAVEMEVVKNDDSFAEVVHGFVQHSEIARRRRRQFDDERNSP